MYDSLIYTAPIAAALSAACAAALAAAGATRKGVRQGARHNERGEGVISAAIAVLIIASLGALMWVGFKTLWENAEETTNSEIAKIGK
ncbi:hypothetical protein [Candidatus Poriferisodalis sp.]|uniref:hypothetical protein n=1 Tax=Candidatus Poriferisodalis sp. TaxID=3101277 RepID=UPI003B5A3425